MKHGFMLIELIVATLIASLVAGVLFAALFQSSRVQNSVDNVIDLSVRVGVVANQLEKDLIGAFIPTQAEEKKEDQSSSAKATEDKTKEKSADKQEQKTPAKEKPKPIEKIFYSTNKKGQLDTLTFVTNNPLVVYVGKDVGVVKPKVVRVQYTLKPETEKKDSYALFRQEGMELNLENYKNVTPYEVIGGIKKCTVTFTARIAKEPEKQQFPETNPAKVLYEYKTLNEWVSEQKKDESKEKKEEFPRIPYSVEMKLILWDKQEKKEKSFTIVCEIPTDFSPIKEHDKKELEKPKKEDKTAEQPAAEGIPPATLGQTTSTTREIIRVVDGSGKVLFEAEKTDATMNEVKKRFGRA